MAHVNAPKACVSKDGQQARCAFPSFETPRCARLLRMRLSVHQHSTKQHQSSNVIELHFGVVCSPGKVAITSGTGVSKPGFLTTSTMKPCCTPW